MIFYISCQGGVREGLERTRLQFGTGAAESRHKSLVLFILPGSL